MDRLNKLYVRGLVLKWRAEDYLRATVANETRQGKIINTLIIIGVGAALTAAILAALAFVVWRLFSKTADTIDTVNFGS